MKNISKWLFAIIIALNFGLGVGVAQAWHGHHGHHGHGWHHGWHGHHGWHHGWGYVNCRWVGGYWHHGYWIPARRVCWD